MRAKRVLKRVGIITAGLIAVATAFCVLSNRSVIGSADGKIFTSTESIPSEPVALVLGAAPIFAGRPNAFFQRRIDAAAKLYHAHKVTKVLVSGDNGTVRYDEPTAMCAALVKLGVPEKDIVLDYAGFRTLDSIVRAKEIFGVTRCIIVTDDFHLPRALYIAESKHLKAIGYQTEPLPRRISPWTYVREVGARSQAWIDVNITHRQPRYLRRQEPIQI